MDRDSAHFAQASKQMLESGNFFQIRFQDITRFQKPPGINWLQALTVKLSGQKLTVNWPYRLPSFFGGLLSVIGLFAFVKRLINREVAIVASCLLASSLLFMVEAHLAVIDAQLLLSVIMMQGALWLLYEQKTGSYQRYWCVFFWAMMSYGFVLKGVTPLVGFLTIAGLCVTDKSLKPLKMTSPVMGVLLFLASCIWVFYVSDAEGTNYLYKMIEKDLLPKLTGGHESHGQPPLFHLAILPVTFWPASIFLFLGLRYGWQQRAKKITRFLLAWLIPTWLFFELMPTKLPQYVLPTFPALSILCSLAIVAEQARSTKVYRGLLVLWLAISLVLAAIFIFAPLALHLRPTSFDWLAAIAIFITASFAFYKAYHEQFKDAFVVTVLLAILSLPLMYGGLLPGLKPLWITQAVKQVIIDNPSLNQVITDKTPIIADTYQEPSLAFSLGTKRVQYAAYSKALTLKNRTALLVSKTNSIDLAHHAFKANRSIKKIADIRGFNYNKGRWLDLELLVLESVHLEQHDKH